MSFQNEIPEDEWVVGLEFWAREYLKGEGGCGRTPSPVFGRRMVLADTRQDSSSLVSLPALKRAYEILQLGVRRYVPLRPGEQQLRASGQRRYPSPRSLGDQYRGAFLGGRRI
jgi:hypothetical protein